MPHKIVMVGLLSVWLTACGSSVTPHLPPTVARSAPSAPALAQSTASPAPTIQPTRSAPTVVPTAPSTAVPTQPPAISTTAPQTAPPATLPATLPATASIDSHVAWLVAPGADGLLLISADGQTKRSLPTARMTLNRPLGEDNISPARLVAFAGGDNPMTPDREGSGPLMLNVLNIDDGSVKPIAPLFSPDMEQALKAAAATGDRTDAIEAGIAVVENDHTLAWSPDGRYLAFIAASDGPSSDVYSYDRASGQIKRLTDGANQAARLFWSPDSKWIVHEEVESFGTGAGWNVKAVWAAAPDGSGNRKLYDTTASGDEVFVEWVSPEAFLVYSWTPIGLQNIRLVTLTTGEAQRIGPPFAVQAFDYDPWTKTQLYALDDFTAQQQGLTGGLYLAAPALDKPTRLASGDWYTLRWLPQTKQFFAKGQDGVISIALDGTVKKYEGESALPIESPDGAWLLAWGDGNFTSPIGLRLYAPVGAPTGELARTLTSDSVTFATWSPDANGLFYLSDGALYFVAIPNGAPVLVEKQIVGGAEGLAWVKP